MKIYIFSVSDIKINIIKVKRNIIKYLFYLNWYLHVCHIMCTVLQLSLRNRTPYGTSWMFLELLTLFPSLWLWKFLVFACIIWNFLVFACICILYRPSVTKILGDFMITTLLSTYKIYIEYYIFLVSNFY